MSDADVLGLLVATRDEPGVLYRISEAIFKHGANVTYIAGGAHREHAAELQLEVTGAGDEGTLIADLVGLEGITKVTRVPTFQRIYGKRVIVVGGGAQVGMVAQGAISEADRHNIRGERISVDTIPLVGEEQLAQAVRAVARLHRARVLVLAGALMGGDISRAVREIKEAGIIVLCTNMAGSVPDAADVVVSDPVEAGVMAVMLIADTASFSIDHVRGRRF
jgi:energy-converting hydrogenase B subunit Q